MVREISNNTGMVSSLSQHNNIMSERLELAREAQSLCDRAIRGIDTIASSVAALEKQADEMVEKADRAIERCDANYDRVMNPKDNHDKHSKHKEKPHMVPLKPTLCERLLSWIKTLFSGGK